jgi:predicted amino acid dehydrogenase
MFERFLENGMKHLSEKLSELTVALTAQSQANGEAIAKVLEGQADRRELCGKRGAEIETLQYSDEEQWKAITDLRRLVWMGAGGLTVVNTLLILAAKLILG